MKNSIFFTQEWRILEETIQQTSRLSRGGGHDEGHGEGQDEGGELRGDHDNVVRDVISCFLYQIQLPI